MPNNRNNLDEDVLKQVIAIEAAFFTQSDRHTLARALIVCLNDVCVDREPNEEGAPE